LEELLGAWPELRVNIDCKADSALPALVAVIKRTASIDRVCVGAFNDLRVRRLRAALGPGLCTAMGPGSVSRLRFGRSASGADNAAQVPVRSGRIVVVNQQFVDRAHRLGIHVHVWTIDDPVEIERLLDMGVDGIMTDRPAVLRDVLERRGQWVAR
jgi:glycerophosphoryl diester phosphodiesterase